MKRYISIISLALIMLIYMGSAQAQPTATLLDTGTLQFSVAGTPIYSEAFVLLETSSGAFNLSSTTAFHIDISNQNRVQILRLDDQWRPTYFVQHGENIVNQFSVRLEINDNEAARTFTPDEENNPDLFATSSEFQVLDSTTSSQFIIILQRMTELGVNEYQFESIDPLMTFPIQSMTATRMGKIRLASGIDVFEADKTVVFRNDVEFHLFSIDGQLIGYTIVSPEAPITGAVFRYDLYPQGLTILESQILLGER